MKRRHLLKSIAATAAVPALQWPALARAQSATAVRADLGWRMLGGALPYLANISGFGSSAADTAVSNAAITTRIYVDPERGLAGNPGSFAAPINRLPATLVSNTKYLVAAGTTMVYDWNTTNTACQLINVTNVVVSVYDRNITSGDPEIKSQPQPFVRATAGGWVKPVELETRYFKMVGNGGEAAPAAPSNGRIFGVGGNSSNVIIRGVWMDGASYAAVNVQGAAVARIEDCVITNTGRIQTGPNANAFGGNAIRFVNDGVFVPGNQLVRCFVGPTGDDCIWAGGNSYAVRITDCAIRAHANFLDYQSVHSDGIQLSTYPGNYVLRRNVIEHYLQERGLIDDDTNVSGNYPVGSAVISAGDGTVRPSSGLAEDCIILSNQTGWNISAGSPETHRRVLTYVHRGAPLWPCRAINRNGAYTEDRCATVFDNPRTGDVLYQGVGTITQTTPTYTFMPTPSSC